MPTAWRRRPTHQPSWTPGCAPSRALATRTLARAREGLASNPLHRLPRRPLRRVPRRALPRGAARAGRRVLHPGRVERRAPAALVVARELEVEALVRHADCDVADAGPGVEPCAESPERALVVRALKTGESECCSQESGALIEHALLLDDLVGPQQQRVR